MTLFLSVLKIIGIVLLIIIAVVLSLLLIILFVPFRYRIKGNIRAKDDYYDFRADVTWFLHMIHGIFLFLRQVQEDECSDQKLLEEQGFHYEIRLFGIKIRPREEREEEPREYALSIPSETPEYQREAGSPEEAQREAGPVMEPSADNDREEGGYKKTEPAKDKDYEHEPEQGTDRDIPKSFTGKLRDFSGFLRRLFRRLKSLKENAGCKYRDLCDRIEELRSRIKHYYGIYNDESTPKALRLALNELKRLLLALKPRGYSIDLLYGFDDPALTGEITGILSAVFLSSGKRVSLRPDFDRSIIEGELFFKGRIRIITLVIILWKLYFNKDFRKLYREFRG